MNKIKYFTFILFIGIICIGGAGAKPINPNFDDDNFYKCVVDSYNKEFGEEYNYETYNMTDEELASLTKFSCSASKVVNTKGLEKLVNVTRFSMDNIKFETLDLSNNPSITDLYLTYASGLKTLDISKNKILKTLELDPYCFNSCPLNIDITNNVNLTRLVIKNYYGLDIDLSKNIKLEYLLLENDEMDSIDISKNVNLTYLNMNINYLKEIDLSKNTKLQDVSLGSSMNLENIDLSNNLELVGVSIRFSKITEIDLSKNTKLSSIYLYKNNLTSINLPKTDTLTAITLENNRLTNIDVSGYNKLSSLKISDNQISNVDLRKLTSFQVYSINNNPIKNIYLDESLTKFDRRITTYTNNGEMIDNINLVIPVNKKRSDLNEYYNTDNGVLKDSNGNVLAYNSELLKTGDKIVGNENYTYNIIVLGDVTSDGKITQEDLAKVYKYIKNGITLTEKELVAADINVDGKVDASDIKVFENSIVDITDVNIDKNAKLEIVCENNNVNVADTSTCKIKATSNKKIAAISLELTNDSEYDIPFSNLSVYNYSVIDKVNTDNKLVIYSDNGGSNTFEIAEFLIKALKLGTLKINLSNVVFTYDDFESVKVSDSTYNLNVSDYVPKVTYESKGSSVLVKVTSPTKLASTKPSWTLSSDGYTYSLTFKENKNYSTIFKDIYGNEKNVNIVVSSFNVKPTLTVTYETNPDYSVNAVVRGTEKFKDTKPSWTLSSDGYTYTKKYTSNQDYNTIFTFVDGTNIYTNIKVVKNDYDLKVNYKLTNNGTVEVSVISNSKFKDTKPSWTLSGDSKTYTKVFNTNQVYTTSFENSEGIKKNVTITINQLPEINISYETTDDGRVKVIAYSALGFKDTKSTWTLSEDSKTYTKIYSTKQNYSTVFEVLDGSKTVKSISLTMPKFEISIWFSSAGEEKVKVTAVASYKFKDTKPTWTLSEDGKTYYKIFSNIGYQTGKAYETSFTSIKNETVLKKFTIYNYWG